MTDAVRLVSEADAATARGDLPTAIARLEQAAGLQSGDCGLFLKLAGLRRAAGQPGKALETVHRALAVEPRDFTALLLKASLLDQMGHPEAGEAWSHALVQLPNGELAPQLVSVVEKARARAAEWAERRESGLAQLMAPAEAAANEEELKRLRRFRSNAVRRTRTFHSSPTHFHFPELAEREFHPRRLFPWIEQLEAQTETIASEFAAVMASERAELVPYIEYPDHLPLDQWKELNRNRDWTAIHLYQNGALNEANARHCPKTIELLASLGQPAIPGASPNAMFSLLAPRTAIPAHVGYNNARLVCHLPLIVPEGCWFRVGEETRAWKRGEAFVFDDTIEHEALNPSDELRVVFIFDLWHPGLSEVERQGVAALIAGEGGAGAGL
jgi:aspartyl/asparaginyl beta-hydroxylase (cupin superfamily)